jgi:hypothetical protein
MSNSFASPPPLADPQTVVAGQPISYGAINSIGQTLNYSFGVGGITNIISQAWSDGSCSQSDTTYQTMCEWKLPQASNLHLDLEVYLLVHGTGSIRLTLDFGGTSDVQEVATSGGGESLYISTLSLSSFGANIGTLTLEGKATTGTIKIASIMARWAPLTSPLPTSNATVMGNTFKPFGIGRLDDEKPLSARVGHNMIRDIETLRERLRTLVSWSSVQNADTSIAPLLYGPAEWLGSGDIMRLLSPVTMPWAEVLPNLKIWVAIKAESVTGDLYVDVAGSRLTISSDGWHSFVIPLIIDGDSSGTFKMTIYRVGLDPTPLNLTENGWDVDAPPSGPIIVGLCMWSA